MSTSKQMKYIDSAGKETIVDIAVNAANVENNAFTQAAARTNIASGETLPGILGKLSKWFADLKAVAWSGKYSDLTDRPALGAAAAYGVANDCGTTAANYVLDARQGQVLQANINQVNNSLTGSINAVSGTLSGLNGAVAPYLTGCVVTSDGANFYAQYGGLKKKLGDPTVTMYGVTNWNMPLNLSSFPNYHDLVLYKTLFPIVTGYYNTHTGATGHPVFRYDAATGILSSTSTIGYVNSVTAYILQ